MNTGLSHRIVTIMFFISLSLWGCGSSGDGGNSPPPDTTPPSTSVTCSPLANAAGWNNINVTCRLTATDNLGSTAVREIRYRINTAPEVIIPGDSATINLTEEGENTVIYFAVDLEGNKELEKVERIWIDKSLPIITAVISPAPINGWNKTNVTVSFICSDGPSGITTCPSDVDLFTDVIGKVITGSTADIAGNRASASVTVNIDKTPPTVLSTKPTDKPTVPVDIYTDISATFSEQMDPSTLTQNTFIVKAGDSPVPGAVSLTGTTATFKPSDKLFYSTSFTATLTSVVKDLAGNSLGTYIWSFDTRDRAWGTATPIETNIGPASNPQVAMDVDGNAVAVWVQGNDIWANRYAAGSGWTPSNATRIEADSRPALNPQVAMDLIGNAMAVWVQGNDTWANRLGLGSVWSPSNAIQIEANAGPTSNPQVAMDDSGNAVAVWVQPGDINLGSPDNNNGIWANRYSVSSRWSSAIDIRGPNKLGAADSPHVAMDGLGNAMAVWVQNSQIWANRYLFGSVWSRLNTALIEATAGTVPTPQVAMDAFGDAMAVWVQDGHIRAKRYVVGPGWETSSSSLENNAGTASNPQVAMDDGGNAIAVWVQGNDIWANRYEAGLGWSPFNATRIEAGGGVASSPQLAMDDLGNAVAVWVQGIDIWANRYEVGKGWGSPTLLENSSEPGLHPQVAMNGEGNAIAVWAQSDSTGLSIWANGFN